LISQYTYREDRAMDIALHCLVSRIETQQAVKGYVMSIFIDIEKVFDSTSISSIKDTMERHKISDVLVD